jgi:hypothetical protein
MDVKSVPKVSPFQVTTASEARDEEKSQDKRRPRRASAKTTPSEKSPAAPASSTETPETESSLRQIVDSEKVIQLLNNRPASGETVKGTFGKGGRANSHPYSDSLTVKNLNRKL